MHKIEKVCKTCAFSALCVGESGLEELIARLIMKHNESFMNAGPKPKSEQEKEFLNGYASVSSAVRVKQLLEDRMPAQCPILRSHHANSSGTLVSWEGDEEVFIDE